ncbi:hypothetical protein MMC07_006397 [Pseudocyphellaria aurata]|nr:hypothetical protein [Pseudocyphellaria aurata]
MGNSKKSPKLPIQQILILAICRVAEPIALTSVFPYLPEMIESLNVPKNNVAKWAGIASAAFSLTQAVTGVLWGRASDRWGRKTAILAGVTCAIFSSLLFGFSSSLAMAIIARSLAGITNGNVGTYRTVVAELIPEKELQPRAFSIMPLVFTMGSIFGPVLGGTLANPAVNFPNAFGNSALFKKYPYALPNIAASLLFAIGLVAGTLFLKETLDSRKHKRDYGRVLGKRMIRAFERAKSKIRRHSDSETTPLLKDSRSSVSTGHCNDATQLHPKISERIGLMYTIYGICAILIQFFIFPVVARQFGVLTTLKSASVLFPIAYLLTPFTVLFPTPLTQQIVIFLILLLKGGATIFAFPCMGIMLTNSTPSLRVLGTLNGVATSVSAIGRAIGPAIEGWMFSVGLNIGYVILSWWTLAVIAALGAIPVWHLIDMEGPTSEEPAADESADLEDHDSSTAEPRPGTDEAVGQTPAIAIQQRRNSKLTRSGTNESGLVMQPGSINSVESPLAMNYSSPMRSRRKDAC